jgi:hypothetical protein
MNLEGFFEEEEQEVRNKIQVFRTLCKREI